MGLMSVLTSFADHDDLSSCMSRRVPSLDLLFAFEAVAECKSFTLAAQRLCITQSAVSHQIRRLEGETGLTLLIRSPHYVQLTGAGVELLKSVKPALRDLEAAFSMRGQLPPEPLGVELESSFSMNWMTPRLAHFSELFPNIALKVNITSARVEFAGKTEIAIKWGHGHWPGFKASRLMELHVTPMCQPELASRLSNARSLAECILLHDRDHDGWTAWLELAGIADMAKRDGHIFGDTVVLWQAAALGNGVALCASEFAAQTVQRGELAVLFPDLLLKLPGAYYVLTRPDKILSPAAIAFSTWLAGEIDAFPLA